MSKPRERNRVIFIPIVFNLLVLVIIPTVFRQWGLERALVIAVAALGWPWLMYAIIGRLIRHVSARADARRNEAEHDEFV
jgi:hypothetical protein